MKATSEKSCEELFAVNPLHWNERYGRWLYHYALSRIGDPESAQEVVQETFVAALRALDQYAGRGSESAWLLGILKRKILDHLRGRNGRLRLSSLAGDETPNCPLDANGNRRGELKRFRSQPDEVEREEFWDTFYGCLQTLPRPQATVFERREIDGQDTREICEQMNLTQRNLWVMLHRARNTLSRCMHSQGYCRVGREPGNV